MAHEATINARMPEALKRSGTAVLEQCGTSPTQVIRSLYRYMEREGKVPECLDLKLETQRDVRAKKLQVARSIAGMIQTSNSESAIDTKALRAERIQEKYGELL